MDISTQENKLKFLSKQIAENAPSLKDLNYEQLSQLAKVVMTQKMVKELEQEVIIAGIDYEKEKETFLNTAGKSNSKHTYKAYKAGIDKLENFASAVKINVLSFSPQNADDFIYNLRTEGKASLTINKHISACSAFFTFLERRHNKSISNPFRGTKARPVKKTIKKLDIPSAEEVETIIKETHKQSPQVALAVSIMAYRGLRIGGLPLLNVSKRKFSTTSKGKEIKGSFDKAILKAIYSLKNTSNPFEEFTEESLRKKIERMIIKLHSQTKIRHKYSCHDFRHFFAISEYKKNKDIYQLKNLLSHSSISVTENYLRSFSQFDF